MSATPLRSEGSKPRLQAGGTLNPRRHLYIKRPDDETLLKLLSEGQYVNVLTSRQMGKSSLMVRTAQALIRRGVRCAIVDLAAELGTPADATTYFLGLLSKVARDLKIEVDLQAWWTERPEETVNQRLMRFFREVVLEQVPGPVVCFLDEIDSTLKLPWTDDLFTALRGMHNERPMVPAYERLTFCLIGVAWPNELIKDRRTTAYNVGSTLELRDFDLGRDDLTPLIDALGANREQGRRLIERVLYWTGGHPYLTARLCAGLREIDAQAPDDVDRRVDDGFRSLERVSGDVHFQQVLRFLETRVANGLATFGLYEKVLKGARERDQPAPAHTELKLSGLVKRDEEGCLVVRNRIYERLFDRRWIDSTRPRRALKTYRGYAIAAGIALLIGTIGAGGWIAYLQVRLDALDLAKESRVLAEQGQPEAALAKTEQALRLMRAKSGDRHANTGFLLDDLATLNYRLGRLNEALAYAEQAVSIIAATRGQDSLDYAAMANNQATILSALGRFGEAIPLYESAHAIFLAKLGSADERTASTARSLGIQYSEVGDPERAQAYFDQALEAARALHGPNSLVFARALLDRAGVDLMLEAVTNARAAAEQAHAIVAARDPVPVADLAQADVMLARVDIHESRLSDARTRLEQAADRFERAGIADYETAAAILYNLGSVQALQGQSVEAEATYRRLLELYRLHVGDRHPAVMRTLNNLAILRGKPKPDAE